MNKMPVLLAVDIGNTNVDMGLFRGETMIHRGKLTSTPVSVSDWEAPLSELGSTDEKPAAAIMCSVVPTATHTFAKTIAKVFSFETAILKSDQPLKLKNLYSRPIDVGPDRIANAYGAWKLYGTPALVVDFGTAITIDAISAVAEYLGGVIAPGVGIAVESLAQKTALLPRVEPLLPEKVLGRDTISSIRSGITYGNVGLVKYLIERLKEELGFDAAGTVVITGGWMGALQEVLKEISLLMDSDLTLKGLQKIYENEMS